MKLRHYQSEAADAGMEAITAKKNGLLILPTAAGKSHVIANIADRADGHTLVLQPSKEILEQNYKKLLQLGRTDVSIFSASLGIKRISRITLATIGSIHKKPSLFSEFSQAIIDEADLVNAKEGMYKSFFESVNIPVLGLTATPWRMYPGHKIGTKRVKGGRLIDIYSGNINKILTRTRPRIFSDIFHITQIHELYQQGFLCPLDYRGAPFNGEQLTLNSTGNDYTEASYKRISRDVVQDAVDAVRKTEAKHHLIFTKFIDEAQTITERLEMYGKSCRIVTGETKKSEREDIINAFTAGRIDAVANVGVLTVGFDFPELDHIVLARPTNSARLYYQMLGRGIRIHPDKNKCILTDLCGNVDRMGKIEDWLIEDRDSNKKWRLFNKDKPLTGTDLKSGMDLENESTNSKDMSVIHFGKFKGKKITDVPADYLTWIKDNFSAGDFRNQALDEISRRAVQNVG